MLSKLRTGKLRACHASPDPANQRPANQRPAVCACLLRIAVLTALLALSSLPALAQGSPTQGSSRTLPTDLVVQNHCMASQVSHGLEFDKVESIVQRLAVADPRIQYAVALSPQVNAWETEVSGISLICIPTALVHFMWLHEGQLAFVIAHEYGHALDDRCRAYSSRAQVADRNASGTVLAALFGHGDGGGSRDQRACESRADALGLSFLARAGYDPQDAPAALDSLASFSGHPGTGTVARIAALGQDHPVTPDRVRHLRKLIADLPKPSQP